MKLHTYRNKVSKVRDFLHGRLVVAGDKEIEHHIATVTGHVIGNTYRIDMLRIHDPAYNGASTIRTLYRQMRQQHPDIKTVSGHRVTGVRRKQAEKVGKKSLKATVKLPEALLETILATGVDELLDEGLITLKSEPLKPSVYDEPGETRHKFSIHHREHGKVGYLLARHVDKDKTLRIVGMAVDDEYAHKSGAIALGTVKQLKQHFADSGIKSIIASRQSGRKRGIMKLHVKKSGRIAPSDTWAERQARRGPIPGVPYR